MSHQNEQQRDGKNRATRDQRIAMPEQIKAIKKIAFAKWMPRRKAADQRIPENGSAYARAKKQKKIQPPQTRQSPAPRLGDFVLSHPRIAVEGTQQFRLL